MGRYYKFSKKIKASEAEEILNELREVEGVEKAEILDNYERLLVITAAELYPEIMSRAINISRRVAGGADLSFAGFAYDQQ